MLDSKRATSLIVPAAVVGLLGAASWVIALQALDKPAWGIFLANFLFFTSVTQGVLALAVILRFASAKWCANFFRLAIATATSFLPIALVMLATLLLYRGEIFYWVAEADHNPWYNSTFFITRNALLFAAFYGVAFALGRLKKGMRESGSSGSDQAALTADESENVRHRVLVLGFLVLVTFTLYQTLLSWDFGMILNRHWADTAYAPLFGITSVYAGAGAIVLLMNFGRRFLKTITFTDQHFINMGQLMLGLSVFWVYAWYTQFFSIWFANLPEETEPIYLRIFHGYGGIYLSAVLLAGAIPFVALIFKKVRESSLGVSLVSLAILLGVWLDRYLIAVPPLAEEHVAADLAIVNPINILFTLGVFGLFVALLLASIRRRAEVLPTTEQELADEPLIAEPMGWQ